MTPEASPGYGYTALGWTATAGQAGCWSYACRLTVGGLRRAALAKPCQENRRHRQRSLRRHRAHVVRLRCLAVLCMPQAAGTGGNATIHATIQRKGRPVQ
jgi:hypothetical protein